MGWSIDLYKPDLDAIFAGLEKKYTVQYVDANIATVRIMHEGEMPRTTMKLILGMFPEFVYINFVPNSTFPVGSSIMETHGS